MDTILIFAIILAILSGLVGAYWQKRKSDRVLKDFNEYHITAMFKDGREVWGRMLVFANAIELIYPQPYKNMRGYAKTSFILFKDSINDIESFSRFHHELSPANQRRHAQLLARVSNPTQLDNLWRGVRNFINTFRDAINETLDLLLSRMKGSSASMIVATHDDKRKQLGGHAVGAIGNAFDPLLERYIGRRVVLRVQSNGKANFEYCGVLNEYSPAWVSLMDCSFMREYKLPLSDGLRLQLQRNLDFWFKVGQQEDSTTSVRGHFKVVNYSSDSINLIRIESGNFQREINTQLAANDAYEMVMEDLPLEILGGLKFEQLPVEFSFVAPERKENFIEKTSEYGLDLRSVFLVLSEVQKADIIVSRTIGTVRHAAEFID